MRMFQGEAGGPSGPGFTRRLARLIGAWLYFCGWRLATLVAELFSWARFKSRIGPRSRKARRGVGDLALRHGRGSGKPG
jgi:hypothetical protein